MSHFTIDEGACGNGVGSYEAGLLTLADGATHGVEAIVRLTLRQDGSRKSNPSRVAPGFLASLRDALPAGGGLAMPARLAVSTLRAGLGVIEEELVPGQSALVTVEIVFDGETTVVARMPPDLIATIRRDRELTLAALARASRTLIKPVETPRKATEAAEALTSIFRYEKRNGRLRRIAEPDPSSKD